MFLHAILEVVSQLVRAVVVVDVGEAQRHLDWLLDRLLRHRVKEMDVLIRWFFLI